MYKQHVVVKDTQMKMVDVSLTPEAAVRVLSQPVLEAFNPEGDPIFNFNQLVSLS